MAPVPPITLQPSSLLQEQSLPNPFLDAPGTDPTSKWSLSANKSSSLDLTSNRLLSSNTLTSNSLLTNTFLQSYKSDDDKPPSLLASTLLASKLTKSPFLTTTSISTSSTKSRLTAVTGSSSAATNNNSVARRLLQSRWSTESRLQNCSWQTNVDATQPALLHHQPAQYTPREEPRRHSFETTTTISSDESEDENVVEQLCAAEEDKQPLCQVVPRFEAVDREGFSDKTSLVNLVSGAMLAQVDFAKDGADIYVCTLKSQLGTLAGHDPEFILKTALYSRQSLNIRSVSNYIVAWACTQPKCRPFVRAYFGSIIRTPSDMLEVADLYARNHANTADLTRVPLPVVLRKAIHEKFPDFDTFELAKHNKAKRPRNRKKPSDTTDDQTKPSASSRPTRGGRGGRGAAAAANRPKREAKAKAVFNLKKIVRQLHIEKPAEVVMSIIGKRYPKDTTAFVRSGLLGSWDCSRAGKRMKLPIPETWETQISSRGNKAEVWQELLDNKKLPFMAMLRNLRNIIQAGVEEKYHAKILWRLQDERQVINSRQFPFRFFSAYVVLDELRELKEKTDAAAAQSAEAYSKKPLSKKKVAGRRNKKEQAKVDQREKRLLEKQLAKPILYDDALLQRYQTALDAAVKIATRHNVPPIPGRSLVVVDALDEPVSRDYKGGTVRTVAEVGVLLGLMCCWSGEHCRLFVRSPDKRRLTEAELQHKSTILANMKHVLEQAKTGSPSSLTESEFLNQIDADTFARHKLDQVVFLGQPVKPTGNKGEFQDELKHHLHRHRAQVNPKLQFVNVDLLSSSHSSMVASRQFTCESRDIYLSGYSDQLLRFISERGNEHLLEQVETIGRKFSVATPRRQLDADDVQRIQQLVQRATPKPELYRHLDTHYIRVFISSTFSDMMSERNLLCRHVMPAIEAQMRKTHANAVLVPIDLRWGLRSDEMKQASVFVQCMQQVMQADILIGLVGNRCGHRVTTRQLSLFLQEHPQFTQCFIEDTNEPVKKKKKQSRTRAEAPSKKPVADRFSITEAEMRVFAHLCQMDAGRKRFAHYFIRRLDMSTIPKKQQALVKQTTPDHKQVVRRLRDFVMRQDNYCMYDARWAGLDSDGFVKLDGLDSLAAVVFGDVEADCDSLLDVDDAEHSSGDDNELWLAQWARVSSALHVQQPLTQQLSRLVNQDAHVLLTGADPLTNAAVISSWLAEYQKRPKQRRVLIPCQSQAWPYRPELGDVLLYLTRAVHCLLNRPAPNETSLAAWRALLNELAGLGLCVVLVLGDWTSSNPAVLTALLQQPLYYMSATNHLVCQFVVSVSGDAQKQKQQLPEPVNANWSRLVVPPLAVADRRLVIESLLQTHAKTLDSRSFTNHLNQLSLKRDASTLSYLKLACDYLTLYATHDTLRVHLQQLASSRDKLLEGLIGQAIAAHGKANTCAVLAVLVFYSTQQMSISDQDLFALASLFRLVSQRCATSKAKTNCRLATVMRMLRGGRRSSGCMSSLGFTCLLSELTGSVCERGNDGRLLLRAMCQPQTVLAAIAKHTAASNTAAHWTLLTTTVAAFNNVRCSALPSAQYYLMAVNLNFQLNEPKSVYYVLSSVRTLRCIFAQGLAQHAVGVCERLLAKSQSLQLHEQKYIQALSAFLAANQHFLKLYPGLLRQQILALPTDNPVFVVLHWGYDKSCQWQGFMCQTQAGSRAQRLKYTALTQDSTCLAQHTASGRLAVGQADGSVTLIGSGQEEQCVYVHAQAVTACCFVDDNTLLTCSFDGQVRLTLLDSSVSSPPVQGHRSAITAANVYGWDGRGTVLTAGWDGHIRQWLCRAGQPKQETDLKTPSAINCLAVHDSSQLALTGHWDNTVRAHSIVATKCKAVWRGHETSVTAVAFNGDATQAISADMNGQVRIWATAEGITLGAFSAHQRLVKSMCVTGDQLVSASDDGLVKIWKSGLGVEQLSVGSIYDASCRISASVCALQPSGTHAVVAYNTNWLVCHQIDNLRAGQSRELWKQSLAEHTTQLLFVPSPHSRLLIVVAERRAQVLDYVTGDAIGELDLMSQGQVRRASSAADFMALAFGNGSVAIYALTGAQWRRERLLKPVRLFTAHEGACNDVAVHLDMALYLATVGADMNLVIWKTSQLLKDAVDAPVPSSARQVVNRAHTDAINAVAFSDSRPLVVTGGADCLVKVWQQDDARLLCCINVHDTAVLSVHVKLSCIVSRSSDGRVCVSSAQGSLVTSLPHAANDVQIVIAAPTSQTVEPEFDWAAAMEAEESGKAARPTPPTQSNSLRSIVDSAAVVTVTRDDARLVITNPFKSCLVWQQYVGELSACSVQRGQLVTAHPRQVQWWGYDAATGAAGRESVCVTCVDCTPLLPDLCLVGHSDGSASVLRVSESGVAVEHTWPAAEALAVNSAKWLSPTAALTLTDDGQLKLWLYEDRVMHALTSCMVVGAYGLYALDSGRTQWAIVGWRATYTLGIRWRQGRPAFEQPVEHSRPSLEANRADVPSPMRALYEPRQPGECVLFTHHQPHSQQQHSSSGRAELLAAGASVAAAWLKLPVEKLPHKTFGGAVVTAACRVPVQLPADNVSRSSSSKKETAANASAYVYALGTADGQVLFKQIFYKTAFKRSLSHQTIPAHSSSVVFVAALASAEGARLLVTVGAEGLLKLWAVSQQLQHQAGDVKTRRDPGCIALHLRLLGCTRLQSTPNVGCIALHCVSQTHALVVVGTACGVECVRVACLPDGDSLLPPDADAAVAEAGREDDDDCDDDDEEDMDMEDLSELFD